MTLIGAVILPVVFLVPIVGTIVAMNDTRLHVPTSVIASLALLASIFLLLLML